jgi:signal transduction histidine kinase
LTVQDAGRGTPPERLAEIRTKRSGVEFRGMRERIRQQIHSDKTVTKIDVTLPAKTET